MRSKTFKAGELTEITMVMKNKIRRFIRDYMAKLFKKQPKEERSTSTSALVNGTRNSISHVIVVGADGAPLPSNPIFTFSKDLEFSSASSPALSGATGLLRKDDQLSQHLKGTSVERKPLSYGDVEVDDDDDVQYGDEDDDEADGDLDVDDDDDDAGVAAVPSSSVELSI